MLTNAERELIIKRFLVDLTPMAVLAADYGISRQAIHKIVKRAGVNVAAAAQVEVTCAVCGGHYSIARNRARVLNNTFCSRACYYIFLKRGNYKEHRHSSRLARAIVEQYHTLQAGQVVHHIDGNQSNNRLDNLIVFASQADHVRFHRGFDIQPVWRFT